MIGDLEKSILKKFGNHLKGFRKERKLSLRQMASRCNVEHSDIKRYEDGQVNLSLIKIIELAKALEIPPCELLKFEFND